MFVKEFDVAVIDSFRNFFSNLMRAPPLNHVQTSPSVLGFGARRRADEEIVLQLALEPIFLYVIG
jgi:hypothetical protein